MTAGAQSVRVALQSYTATQDDYGEDVTTWGDIGEEYAQVFYGRGDERRQAAMEQGQQAATFRFWSTDVTRALTVRDRIVLEGANWDIVSVSPVDRQHFEATGVRAA